MIHRIFARKFSSKSFEALHQPYYKRYTARTDGKEKIAGALHDLSKSVGNDALLDLGAGDGILTGLLTKTFRHITAVEKRAVYRNTLTSLPAVDVVIGNMEDYVPTRPYNVALIAYSLSGVPKNKLPGFLSRITSSLTPHGKTILITYEDGCGWDQFASAVCSALSIPRTGGTARYKQELMDAGFTLKRITAVQTYIWDDNVADLTKTLAFFFGSRLPEYERRTAEFERLLGDLVVPLPGRGIAIEVIENVLEITPRIMSE